MSISDMFPTREIINEKKGRRFAAGVCLNCGLSPCCCAVPKWIARYQQDHAGLPQGGAKVQKAPEGSFPEMSKSTISTFQLFERFPDEPTARVYLESRLWPNGPRCPQCGGSVLTARLNGFYRCNPCSKFTFSVREGTIFGRSKIPLHKWIYAMYLVVTSRKGISSLQLAKEIGVTQKTAWFMLQRLREACSGIDMDKLRGIVEIDVGKRITYKEVIA